MDSHLHGGLPSIRNLRMRHAVVTRDPPNMAFQTVVNVKYLWTVKKITKNIYIKSNNEAWKII
jgi:hypothetical protein